MKKIIITLSVLLTCSLSLASDKGKPKLEQPIIEAIEKGDLETVKAFFSKEGNNIAMLSSTGNPAIMYAAADSQADIVIWLIENGASAISTTKDGFSPLHAVVNAGKLTKPGEKIVEYLVKMGANPDEETTKNLVIEHGDENVKAFNEAVKKGLAGREKEAKKGEENKYEKGIQGIRKKLKNPEIKKDELLKIKELTRKLLDSLSKQLKDGQTRLDSLSKDLKDKQAQIEQVRQELETRKNDTSLLKEAISEYQKTIEEINTAIERIK